MISEEQTEQSLQVPTPATPGRIRSHSLKPQHSRIDYARRKSAADVSSTIVPCWDASGEQQQSSDVLNKTPSPSWLKRRFTFFSLEQPMIDDKRRMTTDRLSFFDEKSYSELLKQKRPSLIAQMMEVETLSSKIFQLIVEYSIIMLLFSSSLFQSFVRRISSRKKKRNNDREREEGK